MATTTIWLDDVLCVSISAANSFWGGLSGTLSLTNNSLSSLENWQFSFVSSYSNFDVYNADTTVQANADGTYTVNLKARAGAPPLPAGGRLDLGFTVNSSSDSNVTIEEVLLAGSPATTTTPPATQTEIPQEHSTSSPSNNTTKNNSNLKLEIQLGSSWNGSYEGTISLHNASDSAIAAGWSVQLVSDHALRNISDFTLQQQQLADGRYAITLTAASWAAQEPLAAGARLSSYFQATGNLNGQTVSDLFDLADNPTTPAEPAPPSNPAVPNGPALPSNPVVPTGPYGLNSGNSGDQRWGEAYFAPYVDMGLWPVPDLSAIAVSRGCSLLSLGFLQATASGQLGWAGLDALAITAGNSHEQLLAINQSIRAFQQAGGDVMVSLGGMNGSSLAQRGAQTGQTAANLAERYAEVIRTYNLNRLDFDIEGAALADDAANILHSQALAVLQQQYPDLEVWYTLPVLPSGLTSDGLDVVRMALSAGVKLDGVNVMAMDYGESAAPTTGPQAQSMGTYAIQAAEATLQQLNTLFGQFGQGFSSGMLGVTPMLGVNDISSEVFTLADAQQLEDFARSRGLGMLSMWSIARDQPGTLGSASPTSSGLAVAEGSFSAIFNDYGSQNQLNLGGNASKTSGEGSTVPSSSSTRSPDSTSSAGSGGDSPARIVGYFEEWGIYGRDFRVADVRADQLTHLNYSFFGITPSQADQPFMAKELTVLPGGWVQAGYQGLNSNTSGGLGIHDPWAAYEKTFTQLEQLVSRRFDANAWQKLSEAQQQNYLNGGDFDVIVNRDASRLVRAKADTWANSQGGLQRQFSQADWNGLSTARQAYLVDHSQQYRWTDQWQGNFNPSGSNTAERMAAVAAHFAAGPGRSLTLRADGDLLRDANAWIDDNVAAWDKLYAGNLNQLRLLKELNPELNIGLAIGGWTLSGNFSSNLDDAAGRERFTQSIIEHLEYYDFFGTVDFDWEYPGGGGLDSNAVSSQDGQNLALTLQLLDQKLQTLEQRTGRQIEISVATAGGAEKLANLNLSAIDPYVDFYNVMTYDFHGGWENHTGHQAAMTGDASGYDVVTAIAQFQKAGIAMDKLVLGAPAYTRAWGGVARDPNFGYGQGGDATLAPGSYEKGSYDHKDLITGIQNGSYELVWDDTKKAAFAYNPDSGIWSSIETTATIAGKAAYVQQAGLGGMMFWAVSNDSRDEQSLINAAHDALIAGSELTTIASRSPGFDHVLGGDGQFQLSDFTQLV